MSTTTTADLLLAWDARRPRSKQTEFGMSELGGCRRRAGYRLAGIEPTNTGGSVQAVMGTAIHVAVASMLREMQAEGLIPADDLIEHEVRFAGILGHLDRYEPAAARVTDTKTTSSRWLAKLKVTGPTQATLWQTHGYGAALIADGHPVREVAIDYIARDTGEQWRWTGPFNPQHVRDALTWLAEVRDTPLDDLPRDHAPDSTFCRSCPFAAACWDGYVQNRDRGSVLYVENPDTAAWARQLEEARARKKQAEADEAEAKGALDALRPNEDESAEIAVPGFGKALRWTVCTTRRLDSDQVRRDYDEAGRPVPQRTSRSVRLELVAAEGGAA